MPVLLAVLTSLPLAFEITSTLPGRIPGALTSSSQPTCKDIWRAGRLSSLLSPLAPSGGLPEGGQSIHTRPHPTPPQVLVPSPSSVTRIQAQGQLPPRQGSATHLPTANWSCSQAMHMAPAQANLGQPEGTHPYWVILSCTHWSVSPTMAHLEEKRATKLTGASLTSWPGPGPLSDRQSLLCRVERLWGQLRAPGTVSLPWELSGPRREISQDKDGRHDAVSVFG